MNASLTHLHILITRPKHQAANISQQLKAAGAMVSCLPVIEIAPPADEFQICNSLQQIDNYDNVIFVSSNAVKWAFKLGGTFLQKHITNCRIGAIGNKTAAALSEYGIATSDMPAAGFNSEEFLALASMQAQELLCQRILIIRGEGGRELLARTLMQRGAKVDYAEVYRRVCPPISSAYEMLQRQVQSPLDIIALTSCEGLHNLVQLLQKPHWLWTTPLLVGSERIARESRALGFQAELVIAADPSDRSMQDALSGWRQGNINDR